MVNEKLRVAYSLSVEDNLIYLKKIFFSKKNPSIVEGIQRWIRKAFLLLVVLYPLLIFVLTNSVRSAIITGLIGLLLMGVLWLNATKIYWARYCSKAKKDLIRFHFDNDPEGRVPIEAVFTEEEVTIISEARTKTLRSSDICLTEVTEDYIIFYTIKYDGSFIPLNGLINKQEVIAWFS
ncbi:hypothetical protein [Candidatus Enterococcus clewellii]|uniref:YcxB-like protein domain-containing protein n=1 Tax=Candidatus Enterococcus clewellii TaxID=1834193 RepID=A0A242KDH9_9ENTE|nr:hypothetical protein [Enterococcus sp. 9E7_DIV0242]OTP18600.1 hypothetical protein A5888_000414 [Enterococcus sp. 9E7_DIV0242]